MPNPDSTTEQSTNIASSAMNVMITINRYSLAASLFSFLFPLVSFLSASP